MVDSSKTAIITNDGKYTYSQLLKKIALYNFESNKKELVLLICENNFEMIAAYLAVLRSGHAVMLISHTTNPELVESIVAKYQPKWIIGSKNFIGYTHQSVFQVREKEVEIDIHEQLAILLSTSGTTGSQKFVRLSYNNVQSNAESIVQYLNINEHERAVMNLPMSYSYGMSIVNSHLQAGASIYLTEESVLMKSFWENVRKFEATSLSGVPFTYQMLHRVGFTEMDLPHLKTLTQAGGRLNENLVKVFGEFAKEKNKKFFVMYGQTEASPRISYIPPEQVLKKSSSIGTAIPGGELFVDPKTSELIYKGPNVMMGYAESLSDLAKGDELRGILNTGDTAKIDEDGFFIITGRMKRFIKIFGLRINLDEIEKKLETNLHTAIACIGNDEKLIVAIENKSVFEDIKVSIEQLYKLHKTAYKVV
ncbi:phosphatase, partial [Butyricicoccus sp. 1XD8-22]